MEMDLRQEGIIQKVTRRLCGNNLKRSITGLLPSITTIKNLKANAKNKSGAFMQKACHIEKLPRKLALLPVKCSTLFKQLKKDSGLTKTMNNKITLSIRNATEDDVPFLFATYLKHNWYDKTNSTMLPKMVWLNAQRKRLEKIYQQNKVRVCCLSEDPDLILGYGFLDLDNKPFVYVKQAFRKSPENIAELLKKTITEEQQ